MILLDTHILIWAQCDPAKLSRAASSAIRRARRKQGLAIAAISLWETAQLLTRGRIRLPGTIQTALQAITEKVVIHPLTAEIAITAAQFPDQFPGDPIDRLIAATAVVHGMAFITRDERLRCSPLLNTIW